MSNITTNQRAEDDTMIKASDRKTDVSEGVVKKSISLYMLRHAESNNNQVYRNARYIYRGGTPEFDEPGWLHYVETHRKADPDLSDTGNQQAQALSHYLAPHLLNQASHPVQIITSPMKRTLQTIRPTLEKLQQNARPPEIKVVAFYHESEGCHDKDKPVEGMNPDEIKDLMKDASQNIDFVGFPDMTRGWYGEGKGAETRVESETRAAKFYCWLCEYLDHQLENENEEDVFDAGVAVAGEETENEHDKMAPRLRRRRTAILVGHGDFMSLVLKRCVAGFGHAVETEGIPHRSAFVHYNTGMTELEYFGQGRFLVMSANQTPHITPGDYATLRTGGSLKDGWSYLVPGDEFVLNAEVSVAFSDEVMDEHVREQKEALKSLYLSSQASQQLQAQAGLTVDEEDTSEHNATTTSSADDVHFIVQRGLQVVGVATYSERSGHLYDVAVRPSAQKEVAETLMKSVKDHAKKVGRSGSLLVRPRSHQSRTLFEELGFLEKELDEAEAAANNNNAEASGEMELKH